MLLMDLNSIKLIIRSRHGRGLRYAIGCYSVEEEAEEDAQMVEASAKDSESVSMLWQTPKNVSSYKSKIINEESHHFF